MVKMEYVNSSNVEQIGYDPDARELHVYFLNGSRYVYENVDASVFENFQYAPSKGSFVNRVLKGYSYRKES